MHGLIQPLIQPLTVYLMFCFVGAGQDVGRSCILLSIGGKNIMLDCGMHMGYNDDVGCRTQSYFFFPFLVHAGAKCV